MNPNQVEELAKCLVDFNLVRFVNAISTKKKNGIPVINLRVK